MHSCSVSSAIPPALLLSHGLCLVEPGDVSQSGVQFSEVTKLARLLSYDLGRGGSLAHDDLVAIPVGVHALAQQLPEQATGGRATGSGGPIDLGVDGLEQGIPLVDAEPWVLP